MIVWEDRGYDRFVGRGRGFTAHVSCGSCGWGADITAADGRVVDRSKYFKSRKSCVGWCERRYLSP